jgi:cell division protein FtsW
VPGRPDYTLTAMAAVLVVLGLVAVYSASFVTALAEFGDANYYILRQGMWAVIGTVLLIAAAKTDYRIYQRLAVPIMAATIVALLAVLIMGTHAGGARRWLAIGPFTVQPAEFAKLAAVIYLAAWLAGKGPLVRSWEHGLIPFVVIISTLGALIMLEPDLGTTLIILIITVTMFWVAGASILQMTALGASGVVAVGILATVEGYRLDRLQAFFHAERDPLGNGFQTLQALIAMGNGGITGLGLGASRGKFFYIPGSHTDGIFAIIGEELGLIAALAVVGLFVLLMIRGYQVARRARDHFGALVATGITTWIIAQALLNIGGITRVIPLTGVPLPFLSYGGSALAAVMLACGVLISISRYGADRGGYSERAGPAEAKRVVRRERK